MDGLNNRQYLRNDSNDQFDQADIRINSHQNQSYQIVRPTSPSVGKNRFKQITPTQAPTKLSFPYNQQHAPTSSTGQSPIINPPEAHIKQESQTSYKSINTEKLQNVINNQSFIAANQLVSQIIKQHQQEAQQKYHAAWQNYYQKYYENYYIAALQEQQKRFAKQKAEIVDSRQNDGKLSQEDVQAALTKEILGKVRKNSKRLRDHWWFMPSLVGGSVAIIFLLLQYNSLIIANVASFISPGSSSSQTIIVGTGANQPVNNNPRVIIPKINVDVPVIYGLTDLSEKSSQQALQNGAINYPIENATALPGQKGNTVILGHSSADFFADGNYKFIFVQLNRLNNGDLFYLDYAGKRYAYKVINKKIIEPNQINELNMGANQPYASLVTCDPPGSTARRLVVVGEQVSPNPIDSKTVEQPANVLAHKITGKPKTLLEKIFGN